ncbi:aminoacyl-tRNA hydrolase [Candidatus Curtissbacteria bacterium]|nr:aminoacyl-tRNA hydrolase [Candidatus Curtissbacteria bacterium]
MKLVVGLGNPGKKYQNNRHNLGFMVIDRLVNKRGLDFRDDADLMAIWAKDSEAVFVKPTTFMNDSGNSVQAVAKFFKIDHKDVLVVYDELDIEFGNIKLSFNGNSAGHHGIDSMIECLASTEFGRLRIGIGKPKVGDGAGHVLDDFLPEEKDELDKVLDKSVGAVESYVTDGIAATMNRFN